MIDHKPTISVCVANYNGVEVLPNCLDSILKQDIRKSVEIIVHDDASEDASVQLIQAHYPTANLIRSDRNVGFCVSNNRMVSRASGEFVLLLNNDAALLPDALSELLNEAAKHPDGAVLTLPQFDWESRKLVDRGSLLDPFYNPVPNKDPDRKEVGMAIGACLWIPRADWERLGGFQDWFGSIAEDLWLCCKARLAGIPVYTLKTSGFLHRQGHSFGGNKPTVRKLSSSFNRRMLSERNKTFVLVCMTPQPVMPLLFLSHACLLFLEGCIISLVRLDVSILNEIYLSALRQSFRKRKLLAKMRAEIQSDRKITVRKYFSMFLRVPWKLILLFRYGFPNIRRKA